MTPRIVWTDAFATPVGGAISRPYQPRHAAPGLRQRAGRAVVRGTARLIAWPLWPGYVAYRTLELRWQ